MEMIGQGKEKKRREGRLQGIESFIVYLNDEERDDEKEFVHSISHTCNFITPFFVEYGCGWLFSGNER